MFEREEEAEMSANRNEAQREKETMIGNEKRER